MKKKESNICTTNKSLVWHSPRFQKNLNFHAGGWSLGFIIEPRECFDMMETDMNQQQQQSSLSTNQINEYFRWSRRSIFPSSYTQTVTGKLVRLKLYDRLSSTLIRAPWNRNVLEWSNVHRRFSTNRREHTMLQSLDSNMVKLRIIRRKESEDTRQSKEDFMHRSSLP